MNTGRLPVLQRVRRRRRCSVVPPPYWLAQTWVLATTGCLSAQPKLLKSRWPDRSAPGAVVSLPPTNPGARHNAPGRRACSRVGWNSQPRDRRHQVARIGFAAWPDASRQLHALGPMAVGTVRMTSSTKKSWHEANHRGSSRHLATSRHCEMAAPRYGRIVPSTKRCGSETGSVAKSTCRPRLTRGVDGPASPSARQRPHGNALAHARGHTKHQAAPITYAQNTTGAAGGKSRRKAGALPASWG